MVILGSAWESVTRWMGDEYQTPPAAKGQIKTSSRAPSASLGITTATQVPLTQLMQNTPTSLPKIASAQTSIDNSQRIDAPITIHAQPGMDVAAIAQMVKDQLQQTLDAQQQQRGRNRRAQLFDAPGY